MGKPVRLPQNRKNFRVRGRNHPMFVRRPYISTLIAAEGTTVDSGAIRKRVALGMAVLAASGLLTLAMPGSAQAASYCSGRNVRTLPFATGSVRVYKSRGYVCAVTFPKSAGARKWMSVSVQARGNRAVVNEGHFLHHAGPITVHAGHRCVWIKGTVGSSKISSGWILC